MFITIQGNEVVAGISMVMKQRPRGVKLLVQGCPASIEWKARNAAGGLLARVHFTTMVYGLCVTLGPHLFTCLFIHGYLFGMTYTLELKVHWESRAKILTILTQGVMSYRREWPAPVLDEPTELSVCCLAHCLSLYASISSCVKWRKMVRDKWYFMCASSKYLINTCYSSRSIYWVLRGPKHNVGHQPWTGSKCSLQPWEGRWWRRREVK